MCRVGEPVDGLLSLTLQINIMTLQFEQAAQQPKPSSPVRCRRRGMILVIRRTAPLTRREIHQHPADAPDW